MRKIVGFGLLAGLALLTPAFAQSADKGVGAAPPDSVAAAVGQMGYDLQSGRDRDGLYHANLRDRDTGKLVHAEFRTDDGEMVSARLLGKDSERHDDKHESGDKDRSRDHEKDDRD